MKLLSILFISLLSLASFAGSKTTKIGLSKAHYQISDVDAVEYIKGQDVALKLISLSGGDPAMNGNYINLAIFDDKETGWKVFELANIRGYKLLPSAKKGYLKLKIAKDIMDKEGNILQVETILFVDYTQFQKNLVVTQEVSE